MIAAAFLSYAGPFLSNYRDELVEKTWLAQVLSSLGKWGWRSVESTHLPPIWPGFDSRTRRHMWVEFVVVSRPCSEKFFSGYSAFPLSLKPIFLSFLGSPAKCRLQSTFLILKLPGKTNHCQRMEHSGWSSF